jgi:hypothetical protein
VRAEALAIFGTAVADLFFNRWDLEVLLDCLLRYIPRCIRNYSRSLWVEAFENFNVRLRCGAPELYAVNPDGFEYRLRPSNQCIFMRVVYVS